MDVVRGTDFMRYGGKCIASINTNVLTVAYQSQLSHSIIDVDRLEINTTHSLQE
jgi:hypothetical protein